MFAEDDLKPVLLCSENIAKKAVGQAKGDKGKIQVPMQVNHKG